MALSHITRDGVLAAISEYDRVGQRDFFDKYGFEAATKYWLIHKGKAYASKAIANVAQAIGMGRPYGDDIRIAGGEATVVGRLRDLGFSVPAAKKLLAPSRSDTWSRDELILALELYMRAPHSPPSTRSKEVSELTKVLLKLALLRGANVGPKFRNANGVYLKMMNFRRFDPLRAGKGMQRGGKQEEDIWNEYSNDLPSLRQAASVIRASVNDPRIFAELQSLASDDEGVEEGGVSYRLHKRYERDRRIIDQKKAMALAEFGCLKCECCEFDFAEEYGEVGFGFIEAHHRKPVFKMKPGAKTRKEDLSLVCSNCHRIIHSRREPLTIDEVKAAIIAQKEGRPA